MQRAVSRTSGCQSATGWLSAETGAFDGKGYLEMFDIMKAKEFALWKPGFGITIREKS
jgi:hypothetical protein